MRLAALILGVAILAAGVLVAWSINRASNKPVNVNVSTGCAGSVYAGNC